MRRRFLLTTAGVVLGLVVVAAAATASGTAQRAAVTQPPATHAAHAEPTDSAAAAPPASASRATALIRATRRHAGRWEDVAAAETAGYRSIGDAITGFEHFVHPQRLLDARTLDPRRPESLVYEVIGETRRFVSAMYILPPGSTMREVPDLGDPSARWHRHRDLCWDADGRIAGRFRAGRCVPSGTRIVTPPMLHVWVVDHPCGPFAGLEGHGRGCRGDH